MFTQDKKLLTSSKGHGKSVFKAINTICIICIAVLLALAMFFLLNFDNLPRKMETAGVFIIIYLLIMIALFIFKIWYNNYKGKSYLSVYEDGITGITLPNLTRNAINIDIDINQINNIYTEKNIITITSNGIEYKFLAPGNDSENLKKAILKQMNK